MLYAEWSLRLIVAAVCGAFVGYERSARLKNAGIRTHVIVALGAALAMLISKYGFYDLLMNRGIELDPSRIAAQIISGISFIGAGTILVRGDGVNGLTTAAGVWATAAVGMAVGSGLYFIAIVASILIVASQYLFRDSFFLKYLLKRKHFHFRVILQNESGSLTTIQNIFNDVGFLSNNFSINNVTENRITGDLEGILTSKQDIDTVLLKIAEDPRVIEIQRED
ncbi:MgtC/SapB family protein [Pediococcus stilesii]|uniref:Mg2+ transporter-C (MgtC) family protein n=1 Tax=Pediococcus stilesii TaxID=331679 RepID=A0A0R2KUV2_9LACO|nr:MgtC/SapB family protein [Pediococcus stilesii]KRN93209.1 Mg2+ transporter-C (MgtC) family protein [Pediococcus stilesii]TLQ03865.1 MgtC/SapB family protein [Pediococcus stilesii]